MDIKDTVISTVAQWPLAESVYKFNDGKEVTAIFKDNAKAQGLAPFKVRAFCPKCHVKTFRAYDSGAFNCLSCHKDGCGLEELRQLFPNAA